MTTTLAAIDPNVTWYFTLFVLTLALVTGTVWANRVWNDLKGEDDESLTDPDDVISPLAQAFAAGQMTREEYLRIKESARLAASPQDDPRPPRRPKTATPEAPPPDAAPPDPQA